MKDLKCALAECEFNQAYCCCAKAIDVSGEAGCNTFVENSNKRKSLFEAGEDFAKRNYDSCAVYCLAIIANSNKYLSDRPSTCG